MYTLEFYQLYLIGLFSSLIIVDVLGISALVKRLFKIPIHKRVKPLDCLPCMTFWISLIITFNPFAAMACYISALLIDSIRYK